jgi:hypothetical protein
MPVLLVCGDSDMVRPEHAVDMFDKPDPRPDRLSRWSPAPAARRGWRRAFGVTVLEQVSVRVAAAVHAARPAGRPRRRSA